MSDSFLDCGDISFDKEAIRQPQNEYRSHSEERLTKKSTHTPRFYSPQATYTNGALKSELKQVKQLNTEKTLLERKFDGKQKKKMQFHGTLKNYMHFLAANTDTQTIKSTQTSSNTVKTEKKEKKKHGAILGYQSDCETNSPSPSPSLSSFSTNQFLSPNPQKESMAITCFSPIAQQSPCDLSLKRKSIHESPHSTKRPRASPESTPNSRNKTSHPIACVQVIRGKNAREKLPGHTCDQCEEQVCA